MKIRLLLEEDEKTYYIYKITNIVNGKIYVGKSKNPIDKRLVNHFWTSEHRQDSGVAIHNAIRKYGKENFKIEEIDRCNTIDELNKKEIYWIEKLHARDKDIGYNIAKGGEGGIGGPMFAGHTHSEETRRMMSQNRQGEKNSNYGNRWKRTSSMKYPDIHGENNPMYGKKQSEESKEKNSKSNKGTATNNIQENPRKFIS